MGELTDPLVGLKGVTLLWCGKEGMGQEGRGWNLRGKQITRGGKGRVE